MTNPIVRCDSTLPSAWQGRTGLAIFGMATVVASACFAFYFLFSTFQLYDDDGYMLIAVKLFLEGNVLYDQIATPYGPFYFLFKWVVHAGLSVPLSHDAVRFIALGHWVLLAATCGLVVYRATASPWWAWVAYGVTVSPLWVFSSEPGHPQEIAASLGAMIPLIAWRNGRPPGVVGWFVAGGLGGLIFMSKVNVGVFCLAAVTIVLVSELRPWKGVIALRIALVLGSVAFPFWLMWSLLSEPGCLRYAALAASATGGAAIVVLGRQGRGCLRWSTVAAFLAGTAVGLIVPLAFVLLHGSSVGGLLRSVVHYSQGQQYFHWFPAYSSPQLWLAIAAPFFAALVTWLPSGRVRWHLLGCAKAAFAVTALAVVVANRAVAASFPGTPLGWAAAWCWLCAEGARPDRDSTARSLLAVLAAWHVLLAYPAAGSQLHFGSFLVTTSAVVCAVDAVRWVAACLARAAFQRRVVELSGFALATVILVQIGSGAVDAKRRYDAGQPLGLAGAGWLRIAPKRALLLRQLVAAVDPADVVFTTSGLNSLFLWTGCQMPAPVLVSHDLRMLPSEDLRAIMAGLAEASRPIVIRASPFRGDLPNIDLIEWIDTRFVPYRRIGEFILMRRNSERRRYTAEHDPGAVQH